MSEAPKQDTEKYNVVQFFENDSYEYVRKKVTAEEAMNAFQHYITSIGAKHGFTKRVIITDMWDFTNVEWEYGKGIVYPTKADIEREKNNEKH